MLNKPIIAVVGVGTIGLTIAYYFGLKYSVIGFDNNSERIEELRNKIDKHKMFNSEELSISKITFTNNHNDLANSNFYIIAVPTTFHDGKPDLNYLLNASEVVGRYLKKGDIVVYESTVYPGVTEEECIPMLEKKSGLRSPVDFGVGYSPERINPGDKEHSLQTIKKIISAQDQVTLDRIAEIYGNVIAAGVIAVSSIKVAEATKIVENTQRDVLISFMNESALMLHKLAINSRDVFQAMHTKWNSIPIYPGLVGGICIGKDSNYLIYRSILKGYIPNVMIAARRVNNYVAKYIADQTIKLMLKQSINPVDARIGICGITFKEDYNETENSLVFNIISELKSFHTHVLIHDPLADAHIVKEKYKVELMPWDKMVKLDAIIFAVAHKQYCKLSCAEMLEMLNKKTVIMDVKSIFKQEDFADNKEVIYWQL